MKALWAEIVLWLLRVGCAFGVVTALAPFLRVGWWPVRLCDFPRLQLGTFAFVVAVGALARAWRWEHAMLIGLAAGVAFWQFAHVAPYTRWWPHAVPSADSSAGRPVRLAILNLDYRNDRRDEAGEVIDAIDADALVLIEFDDEWKRALSAIEVGYDHREGVVRGDGLGIVVWSRVPMRDLAVEHLVSDKRASVWARLKVGEVWTNFVALHPAPPGLKEDDGEREDSRQRDAELVLVAKRVAEKEREEHIVAGDFNDVAWSHTTRLFERLSGLKDPRVGRALLTTYHADHPLFRYPIDHVFVSEGFAVSGMRRVAIPGSDHFGIVAEFVLEDREGVAPDPNGDDREEAEEIVEEGIEDAEEDGER